ncbi:hypothetical protein ElyMa_001675200 [Elysia marginata]|uniref:CTNNB1 binding N-teminal domain-containing protein n=1 Tax=Elysia marginata TaxID=1093978 RepID=A0AAV4JQG6_9GAST|nr:hypothetical protein ElyMa_001675200 [Elysia marginata]
MNRGLESNPQRREHESDERTTEPLMATRLNGEGGEEIDGDSITGARTTWDQSPFSLPLETSGWISSLTTFCPSIFLLLKILRFDSLGTG